MLLSADFAPLLQAAHRLADDIVHRRVVTVVSDAAEGYNPSHDACALLAQAAAASARRRGQPVRTFEFDVVRMRGSASIAGAIRHDLTDPELDAKIRMARAYAQESGPVLVAEVDDMLRQHGRDAFREEWLVPSPPIPLAARFAGAPPFFERHGARRVHEGKYADVVRLEHLLPLERALADWARGAAA
ncbi:MAG: hypothetical protein R2712_15045 [Vicinamibacterales bacterium]